MRNSRNLRILASLLIAFTLVTFIPFRKTEAKTYTNADVIQMFKGDTELDVNKVQTVIAGMNLNTKQRNFFKVIIPLAIQDMIDNDILASLTISQSVWEGGWGVGNIAVVANNIFGIMAAPSWKGKVYCTTTKQVYGTYEEAASHGGKRFFRAYNNWAESLSDHSSLFVNSERYEVFIGLRDYKKACKAVYSTGYATSSDYPDELIKTIESHKLMIFDTIATEILKARSLATTIMPTSVSISASKITLGLGSSYTLEAKVEPSNANSNITWTTSKSNISITAGTVTADKVGISNVLAETVNGMSVKCQVTVLKDFDFVVVGSSLKQYTGASSIVSIPKGVSSIGDSSFKNKKTITQVIIPSAVSSISAKAFSGCNSSMVICGYEGSYAEKFANKNNFTFKSLTNVLIDENQFLATDVSPKSTVSEIIASVGNNAVIENKYNETFDLQSNAFVGTGCTVEINGKKYTIAVKGDVNGDGIISTADFQTVLRSLQHLKKLSGAFFVAADVDGNGTLNTADYLKIKHAFQSGNREVA